MGISKKNPRIKCKSIPFAEKGFECFHDDSICVIYGCSADCVHHPDFPSIHSEMLTKNGQLRKNRK